MYWQNAPPFMFREWLEEVTAQDINAHPPLLELLLPGLPLWLQETYRLSLHLLILTELLWHVAKYRKTGYQAKNKLMSSDQSCTMEDSSNCKLKVVAHTYYHPHKHLWANDSLGPQPPPPAGLGRGLLPTFSSTGSILNTHFTEYCLIVMTPVFSDSTRVLKGEGVNGG